MSVSSEKLKAIKAFLFDIDGVLSSDTSALDEEGEPVRTACIKDGYAIRKALSRGYILGIITGGAQKRVKARYTKLGITLFYDQSREKITSFNDFIAQSGVSASEILYMGDDMPDIPPMQRCGVAACPSDAVTEVSQISDYIANKPGGSGCAREVIELVLREQCKWDDMQEKSGLL